MGNGYRVGRVTELDAAAGRVRVLLDDVDDLVTWWLDVVQPKAGADRVYWMPAIDDQVICLLDEHAEEGVVLGGIYNEEAPPPAVAADVLHVRMSDGSTFEYDPGRRRLSIELVGDGADVVITSTSTITLQVPGGGNVHVGGPGGQELATRAFVQAQYNAHTHLSGSPGTPTSPPMVLSPMVPGQDITAKQKSE